jgi:hypothetical protein
MKTPTHQTVMLKRGKHTSPEHGACVMELASMLAGEPFSDHPKSVCPVIAGFLRAYNDSVDDELRQGLYEIAAKVVGSRTSSATERVRAQRLQEWTLRLRSRTGWRRLVPSRLRRLADPIHPSFLGRLAAHAARLHPRESHEAVLALIDELLATGRAGGHIAASSGVAVSPRAGAPTSVRSR